VTIPLTNRLWNCAYSWPNLTSATPASTSTAAKVCTAWPTALAGRVPLAISGWRFQASADDGETHVFDVEHDGAHWQLVRVYD